MISKIILNNYSIIADVEPLGRSGTLTLSSGAVTELLDGYAFIYSYDSRLRLRSKKLPGCEPVRYAYDTENRLIFSRDGN